ncbi:prepilin peptidase [Patescibacteria group bacterium]|nr:prepilin peptidase [Patescibacteria group bacterium]
MGIFFYPIIFIFGLAVGSFLNCVIYRLAFPRGRSFCPYCKHILSWQDLIPVLSFFILRGKCRYCLKKISWQYPLVELATGILFILILNYELGIMNYEFFDFRTILNSLFLILTSCFLIIIFVYDLKHFIIPDKIIYPAIVITFLYNLILNSQFIIHNSIFAALGAALFFLFIVLVSRGRWMGLGDVKLAFFIGLFLGFPDILIALFFAFLIGAIIGVGLILAKRKTLKSEVPFGPFLVTGTFIALFWGPTIIDWYLNFVTYNL